jgi:hypothetical protein
LSLFDPPRTMRARFAHIQHTLLAQQAHNMPQRRQKTLHNVHPSERTKSASLGPMESLVLLDRICGTASEPPGI